MSLPTKEPVVIWWVRRTLRLEDNPSLQQALSYKCPIIPVFIWAPDEEAPWQPGAASCWWLHHSLERFEQSLKRIGLPLVILKQPTLEAFAALQQQLNITAVVCDELIEPALQQQALGIQHWAQQQQIAFAAVQAQLLFNHQLIQNKSGNPYQVFTPFSKVCFEQLHMVIPCSHSHPRTAINSCPLPPQVSQAVHGLGQSINHLGLLPNLNWADDFTQYWQPGEAGAQARLDYFVNGLHVLDYPTQRDLPSVDGVSKLSPHLHFGEVSPFRIWTTCLALVENQQASLSQVQPYLRQLLWREFAHHLLFHFPQSAQQNLKTGFEAFDWENDPKKLKAWQHGNTGYPIVDAGMKELWHTGWMHNRVRMITGSFLTKNLLTHWHYGAQWFWDTLVDASLANNTLGWQWIAGCGADAAPYFRVFNPILQSQKFDADARYIGQWLPMLNALPLYQRHAPDRSLLPPAKSNVLMSPVANYPAPIVPLLASRDEALKRYQQLRR